MSASEYQNNEKLKCDKTAIKKTLECKTLWSMFKHGELLNYSYLTLCKKKLKQRALPN